MTAVIERFQGALAIVEREEERRDVTGLHSDCRGGEDSTFRDNPIVPADPAWAPLPKFRLLRTLFSSPVTFVTGTPSPTDMSTAFRLSQTAGISLFNA
ncbi:hypothetical protein SNOG_07724 [Parastagonospora nodorum SN15]|uniref:Uncharacterized protein n=1 Tax=Phaeosphaeria nodorum (strain SN15 / ATCC MYA-4574 / FGSC 10173) TaxID=321614 RepID=Q0UKJ0_PHANO|nr:hypothetical protein SNOG_07724 [Parastagonospora nodorum SN15]EAT85190.1 hypothetical protein SNOG_07724 [Parastagonospora nodorum SN15]